MAESQLHGFLFEQHIAAAGRALHGQGANSGGASYTARFDLGPELDPTGQKIPTCIKIAKRAANGRVRVDMADARRAVGLAEVPMTRLVVGVYDQVGGVKRVSEVRHYLIDGETWKQAAGGVSVETISDFHQQLAQGTPPQARAFAVQRKAELALAHPSTLKWAHKVDSKVQRRLQCSLYLDELDALVGTQAGSTVDIHTPETAAFWNIPLPLELPSLPRTRKQKKQQVDHTTE